MPTTDASLAPFLDGYAALRADLPGAAETLRDAAIARFAEAGIPGRRIEGWKYTDLRRLQRLDAAALARTEPADTGRPTLPEPVAAIDAWRVVLVDGRFAPDLSALDGVPEGILPLSQRLAGEPAAAPAVLRAELPGAAHPGLGALNAAMARDGLVVDVPAGVVLERPVLVVHVMTKGLGAGAMHPRTVLRLGEGAACDLIEVFVGEDGATGWTNAVLEAEVGAGGRLGHVVLIDQAGGAVQTGLAALALDRDAAYRGLVVSAGGQIARTETLVRLTGEGASAVLAGGALVHGRRHVDHTTEIVHAAPHCTSEQVFRNVVDDHARSVFQGRVVVEQDAQKTDARQSCRNLLLAPGAEADNKPELRIFADDVKCSHGATVGDLDADALFYLRARGIPEAEARAMLTRAFVAGLLALNPVEAARAAVEGVVETWLSRT